MSTYTWPTDAVLEPQVFTWGAIEQVGETVSPYTGTAQTAEVPFSYRWRVTLGWPPTSSHADQHSRMGFVAKIRRSHRVQIPCFSLQAPAGTLRGSPTVTTTAAQGATSIAITPTSGTTVLRGDLIGLTTAIGLQVVMVTANTDLSAASMPFEPPLRAAVAAGSAVAWDKPAPKFRLASNEWSSTFRPMAAEPIMLDFVEDW